MKAADVARFALGPGKVWRLLQNAVVTEIESNNATLRQMNATLPKATALVVEDDACAAILFKTMLQKEGCQVEVSTDGEAALGLLNKRQYDLVVMDLMMPRVDGMQVLKQMRSMPEHMLTPVIVITAARLKLVEEEASRYGAKLYLDKTQTEKFVAGVRDILKARTSGPPPRLKMAESAADEPAAVEQTEATESKGLIRFFRRRSS